MKCTSNHADGDRYVYIHMLVHVFNCATLGVCVHIICRTMQLYMCDLVWSTVIPAIIFNFNGSLFS